MALPPQALAPQALAPRQMAAGSAQGVSQMGKKAGSEQLNRATAAEQLMLDQSDRVLRQPAGRLALVLHLAQLRPPGPRAYHGLIARAMLEDVARRFAGQVFVLGDGDIVLLCDGKSAGFGADCTEALPAMLSGLFGADSPDLKILISAWQLESDAAGFRHYLTARLASPASAPQHANDAEFCGAGNLAALEEALAVADLTELLSTQTAIHLRGGKHLPLITRLSPLFRELALALTPPGFPAGGGDPLSDPYLVRYLSAKLESRWLTLLTSDLQTGGKLTRAARAEQLPIHFSLTLAGVVSPEFARFTRAAITSGTRFGIKITLMDALKDLELTAYATDLLRLARCDLVLEEVDYAALELTRLLSLQPDLVRLNWLPRLEAAGESERAAIAAALVELGVERVVLVHADSERALIWGQAQGIQRFQGIMIDTVQAAARMAVCDCARACTLRQCATRAGVFTATGRAGCGNPALLDTNPTVPAQSPAPRRAS